MSAARHSWTRCLTASLAVLAMMVAGRAEADGENLIPNGGFEEGTVIGENSGDWGYVNDGSKNRTDSWLNSGSGFVLSTRKKNTYWYKTTQTLADAGNYVAGVQGGGYCSNSVSVAGYGMYTLSFAFAPRQETAKNHDFVVKVDGKEFYRKKVTDNAFVQVSTNIDLAAGLHWLSLHNDNRTGDHTTIFDNFSLVLTKVYKGLEIAATDSRIVGNANPSYGFYETISDETVCTVDAAWTNAEQTICGDCKGWKLYDGDGNELDRGDGRTFTYSKSDAYRRLVWQWEVFYKVTATAGEHGSVTSTSFWVGAGESATVTATATPDEGYAFFRWIGECGNADPAEPTITATLTQGGAGLTALFGHQLVVDPSGDGTTVYTNLDTAVAAAADYDTILVKPGVYKRVSDSTLTISKPIKIVSEGGREVTHVRGRYGAVSDDVIKTYSRGLTLKNDLAILKGLSIWNFGNDGSSSTPYTTALDIQAGLAEYCAVSNSRPNWGGAAVSVSGANAALRHSLVYRCRNNCNSTDNGYVGVVRLTAGIITNCIVRSSFVGSSGYGGGVYVNGANALLTGSDIFSNSSPSGGGGVYLVNGLVENCAISNNSNTAAGVYQKGGTLRNCLVTKNTAGYTSKYGGVYATGGTIENCRIFGNTAYYPDGMQLKMTAGTIRNTVAADKLHSIPCSDYVAVASGVTVENCDFQCPSVNGSRVLNASAYFTSNDVCWIEADKVVGLAPLTVQFKAHAAGASSWSWDFGDGTSTSTAENPSFTFTDTGSYVVTLTAGSLSPVTLDVKALASAAYVATDGGNVFPYDTPAKAAKNLADAHDAVYADDSVCGTVNVAAGTWKYGGSDVSSSFKPWILVNRAVRILGPDEGEALFDAQRKIMTCFLFHPRATLDRITISNGRLKQSSNYGATLHMMAGLVTNCVISKGYCNFGGNASIRGGAIWNSTIKEGTLDQSGVDRPGGGLQMWGTSIAANCLITGNTGGLGGGVSLHTSGAVVSNCVIRNNSGGVCCGGGVGIYSSGTVTHCIITNNTASNGGGGVAMWGGTLRNSLVAKNRANGTGTMGIGYGKSGGGGITVNGGTVENCTVAYNTSASPTRSDELYQFGGTVQNCVFCGKDGTVTYDVYKTAGTTRYSAFRKGVKVTGTHIVTNDLKMASPAADDYTLLFGSPAVDAGMTIAAVTDDLLGVARPLGDAYDMGCYEMDFSGKMGVSFDADITAAGAATEVTLTATVEGGTEPYTYYWTIGETVYETDSNVFKHTFGYGSHDVTLKVKDAKGNESDPVTQKGLVIIKSAVVYVSTNGTATWPYDTWEKATADWNAAVGAVYATEAVPGKIWVADGDYQAHDSDIFTADLSNPIELCGTNPACKAVFDGKSANHKVVKLNNAKSVLANVTIKNCTGGASSDGCCLWLYNGTATNCVFSAGSSWGAGNVYQSGGRMVDCVIKDHNAQTHSGGDRVGGGLYLSGGTAERLVISGCTDGHGGGAYVCGSGAILRDSVIRGNVTHAGGAIYLTKGLVERCVITNNTSYGATSQGELFKVRPGAGVYQSGGTLRNCLVVNNRTIEQSAATDAALYEAGGMAYNNTVWMNTMLNKATNDVYLASGTVANTIAGVMTNVSGTAEGNYVGLAPRFKRPAKGNYRLKPSSPAVSIGVKSYWSGVADPTDIEGSPRVSGAGELHAGCYQNPINGFLLIVR